MMRISATLGVVAGLLFACGCSQKVSGGPESGVDMGRYRSFYVVTAEQADVADAIEKDLSSRGLSVSKGPESSTPATAQAKVLFDDKWVWDLTMYLLEVKIEVVDARSGALLGSGRSYRTSMARKSPKEMVKEVMDKILPAAPTAKPPGKAAAARAE